jgi:hypothetical protein
MQLMRDELNTKSKEIQTLNDSITEREEMINLLNESHRAANVEKETLMKALKDKEQSLAEVKTSDKDELLKLQSGYNDNIEQIREEYRNVSRTLQFTLPTTKILLILFYKNKLECCQSCIRKG